MGARDLLSRFRVREWEAGHLCSAADIDTREELEAAMKLEQSFEVQAPIDVVWAALNDLERVAPCLPGAAITGARRRRHLPRRVQGQDRPDDGGLQAARSGSRTPIEATHTATLAAKGTDKRGQGGATATIVNTLREIDGVTRVDAVTDFAITGRLARFGRGGMIEDISNRLLRDFATCLATRLGDEAPTAPSGAEVTAGQAAPEAVAAAAPEAAYGAGRRSRRVERGGSDRHRDATGRHVAGTDGRRTAAGHRRGRRPISLRRSPAARERAAEGRLAGLLGALGARQALLQPPVRQDEVLSRALMPRARAPAPAPRAG